MPNKSLPCKVNPQSKSEILEHKFEVRSVKEQKYYSGIATDSIDQPIRYMSGIATDSNIDLEQELDNKKKN